MWHIRAEREHHGEREEQFKKIKENFIEKIREESEKSSLDQNGASSVVQNYKDRGEDLIGEGRQKTAAKYM